MVDGQALGVGVIRQHLDDSAIRDFAALALLDHALEFDFQPLESVNPLLYRVQVTPCNRIHGLTRLSRLVTHRQHLAHIVQGKSQLAGVADEGQPGGVLWAVYALVAGLSKGSNPLLSHKWAKKKA